MKLSIIVPTHNRRQSLARTLNALRDDADLAASGEVIVVADGCRDGTADFLRETAWPWPLRTIEQSASGAAAARNAGAAAARGRVLLFLDDDVEPCPQLVRKHLAAHADEPRRAAVGAYPPALEGPAPPVHILKRNWWLGRFHEMGEPGHRLDYRDLLSGNLSLPATLFHELGGFDQGIGGAGGEDYEFGIRLFAAGAQLVFLPQARALHHEHETTDLRRYMRRARQEGLADVRIAERHPAVRHTLALYARHAGGRRRRLARAAAWQRGRLGTLFPLLLTPALRAAGLVGAKKRWLRLCATLHDYWYWRGVREAVGSRDGLEHLLTGSIEPEGRELELNLAEGLEVAERKLDHARPDGLRLRWGPFVVGRIPVSPAAEPLRGRHLRQYLARDLAWPLLKARAAQEAMHVEPPATFTESEHGQASALARTG